MPLTREEIDKRFPLWEAISQLFIDTEIGAYEHGRVVEEIMKFDCSFEEAENIFLYEVAPVCSWNMYAAAGVWTAFDEEWLKEKISENIRRQEMFFPYRWYIKSRFGKFLTADLIRDDWEKVREIYRMKMSSL